MDDSKYTVLSIVGVLTAIRSFVPAARRCKIRKVGDSGRLRPDAQGMRGTNGSSDSD